MDCIPFGKHKKQPLYQIPDDYLRWVLKNVENLSMSMRSAIEGEFRRRADEARWEADRAHREQQPPLRGVPSGVDTGIANEIIAIGRRALANKAHPDHGGDVRKMQDINATADYLETTVRALAGEIRS